MQKVSQRHTGDWICKLMEGNHPGQKVRLQVIPKSKVTFSTENESIIGTPTTSPKTEPEPIPKEPKTEPVSKELIVIGSVCSAIVCGLISFGILSCFNKKTSTLISIDNQ